MQIFILGDDYQIPTHFSSNSDMTSLLGHLSYVTFWVKFKWGMVRCYLAILGDKGYFCIPRMKWIFCHYAKPFFETVVLLGQAEANDLMPGTTTCISNLAYRFFYYVSILSTLSLLGIKPTVKNLSSPQFCAVIWKGRLRGRRGEVTRGKIQRAVPKSAFC